MRFEMRELLGVGGMGQVYRAWDERLGREVALKLLRGGREEVGERVLREARAQARVEHPNICPIYEVGEEDGKLFVAMRLVRGRPLGEIAGDLDLRRKVMVIRKVAEAVQAAHNRGLVHRDLKPSNILVEMAEETEEEGSRVSRSELIRPFVVDFGLAVGPEDPRLTAPGDIAGSPAYLAPEQVLEGRRADRRSDVYALGVTLYEILSGELPYEGSSSLEVLGKMAGSPPEPLRRRAPDLPRDLCWVVEKCMHRDPDRRYGSARLLAEDLDRFLEGEPVLARPPSLGYRLARWLDRHRAVAALTACFVLLALAGGVRYAVDLRQERRQAEAARIEAERVAEFLESILRSGDPRQNQGEVPSVRQVLDRASRRLDVELAQEPGLRARFDGILGSIYTRLGDYQTAETHLRRALETSRGPGQGTSEAHAEALERLGDLRRLQGRFDEARELWRRALELDAGRTASRKGLATIAMDEGEFERARSLLEDVVRARRREGQPRLVANALHELARLERETGHLDRAETLFLEARELLGESDPKLLNNLGMLYHDQGRLQPAMESFRDAIDLGRRLYGEHHRSVASSLTNLGRSARQAGKFAAAAGAYGEVLEIYRHILPEDHFWVGIVLNNLGRLHREQGRYDAAEKELDDAYRIMRAAAGERQPRTLIAVHNRALVDLDRGRLAAAGEGFETMRRGIEEVLGPEHAYAASAHEALGAWHRRAGRASEAARSLRRALEIRIANQDSASDVRTARCRLLLAHVLLDDGRAGDAEEQARPALAILDEAAVARSDSARTLVPLAAARHAMARIAHLGGDGATAERQALAALELLERWGVDESAMTWIERRAELLELLGRAEEAGSLRSRLRRRGYVPRCDLGG